MKYQRKVTEFVTAITFEELVSIGREQNPGREGMPWSFYYNDVHVTHENDDCYLVGSERFERGDMLVTPDKPGAAPTAWGSAEFFGDYEAATLSDEVADREDAGPEILGHVIRSYRSAPPESTERIPGPPDPPKGPSPREWG